MSDDQNLAGKVALVTGASRGIGRSCAIQMARQGARLILLGRDEVPLKVVKEEIEKLGGQASLLIADFARPEEAQEALQERLPAEKIDILVNNAGLYHSVEFDNLSDRDWHETLNVNLVVALLACRIVLHGKEGMIARQWGRIINISSISGLIPEAFAGAYSISKFSLNGATKALALSVAREKITVNAICPGWVDTKMANDEFADPEWCRLNGLPLDDARELTRFSIPQERFIEADEVAALAVFLCSEAARGITGQTINICGGLSLV